MITFVLVLAAFFLGFGLNSALEIKDAITSASIGVAIFVAFLTHIFSRNRERVKEYECVHALIAGICQAAENITIVVESSKKEYLNMERPVVLLPAVEIYNVCSEDLLQVYKTDVEGLSSNKLSDPDSVLAVLKFKLHFNLFVNFVIKYMKMRENVDKEMRNYLNGLLRERARLLKCEFFEEADNILREHNECAMSYFNGFCKPILQQYELMREQEKHIWIGMEKAKRSFL